MMALKPPPSSPSLCYSKFYKYNNYEQAPYIVYSYPQADLFTRLFTWLQAKLTSHVTIDTPTNTFKLYLLQEFDQ